MTIQYKTDFSGLDWQDAFEGVRHKIQDQDGLRLRLVEYSSKMPLHWCERAHYGYLLEGRKEIEYPTEKVVYNPGDGLFIPDGPDHKHRATPLTDIVLVFFVEYV